MGAYLLVTLGQFFVTAPLVGFYILPLDPAGDLRPHDPVTEWNLQTCTTANGIHWSANRANLWTLCGHASWDCQWLFATTQCTWCLSGKNLYPSSAQTPRASMHDVCTDSCWGLTASVHKPGSLEDCECWTYITHIEVEIWSNILWQTSRVPHSAAMYYNYQHLATWMLTNPLSNYTNYRDAITPPFVHDLNTLKAFV